MIDCTSPEPLAHFWAEALHYVIEPPPSGFDSWDDFYRSIGVPEEELGIGADSIADPSGEGPRIWFQVVPEQKSIKNRIHIDVHATTTPRTQDRVNRTRRLLPIDVTAASGWKAGEGVLDSISSQRPGLRGARWPSGLPRATHMHRPALWDAGAVPCQKTSDHTHTDQRAASLPSE